MQSHFFTELQESDFIFRQSRLIKIARNNCIDRYGFILQLQEVCVRTGSVRALIERRNSGRNQLFEAPSNFAICKLKRVAKRHHPFEDFGIMTETLQDLWKVRPIRIWDFVTMMHSRSVSRLRSMTSLSMVRTHRHKLRRTMIRHLHYW